MDSAYLKNHVGTALAKGIAETVTAQPNNPQEYLALFLLHQLQEEERRTEAATRKKKLSELREEWSQQRAWREKAAVDAIQRGFHRFQTRLHAKQEAEEEWQSLYEEAVTQAEELLDQEAALKEANEADGARDAAGGDDDASPERDHVLAKLQAQEAALREARGEFFKAQRFLLTLSKTALGRLKMELADMAERVRMAQDVTLGAYHRAAAQEAALVEVGSTNNPMVAAANAGIGGAPPNLLPSHHTGAAAELAARLEEHRDHRFISVPYVDYLVLRCLCYLLLNATPKATSTPAKVAALVKPAVFVQHLRAFYPIAGYDRGVPLKLERLVPELAAAAAAHGGANGEDEDEDDENTSAARGGNADVPESGISGVSVPFRQPTTRQVRRVQRVLRLCWLDGEYQCEVDPEAYYTEAMIEEDTARADAAAAAQNEGEEGDGGEGGHRDHHVIPRLAEEVEAAQAAGERVKAVRATVADQVKQRGGIVLYGLLRFATAAVQYRQARDVAVRTRQEMGLPVDAHEEMPDDEEEDPLNEEAVVDEETGEIDFAAAQALLEKNGADTEEALAKIWEARDARQREAYAMKAAALRRDLDAAGEEEEPEEEGE